MRRSSIMSIALGFTRLAARPMTASTCVPEFDRHSVVLRPADMPGMDYAGFKVASDADLDIFPRRIEEHGTKVEEVAAGEQPGLGRRLSFIVPTGHRIQLFAEHG